MIFTFDLKKIFVVFQKNYGARFYKFELCKNLLYIDDIITCFI
jgi:hypothetical protein